MASTQPPADIPDDMQRSPPAQDARQGRNVSGMVTVLVISLVLILAAYGVFLALFGGQPDPSPGVDISTEPNAVVEPGPPPPSQVRE